MHTLTLRLMAALMVLGLVAGDIYPCGTLWGELESYTDPETSASVHLLELGSDTPSVYGLEGGVIYALGAHTGDSGTLTRAALRSADKGETWLCLNDMLPNATNTYLWFGARRSGVYDIFPHPHVPSRVVALSAGDMLWTLEDHGEEGVDLFATSTLMTQATTWLSAVTFSEDDPDVMLVSSIGEAAAVYWHVSLDFGRTFGYVGRPEHRLFACTLGSGHSIICECALANDMTRPFICLSEDYGATFMDFPGSSAGHEITLGGVYHRQGGSLVYCIDVTSHVILVSTWVGSYYTSLATAIAGPEYTIPESHTLLHILEAGQPDFIVMSTSERASPSFTATTASIWLTTAQQPAILSRVGQDVYAGVAPTSPVSLLPSLFSVTYDWLSPNPVYFSVDYYDAGNEDSAVTEVSTDEMRSWQPTETPRLQLGKASNAMAEKEKATHTSMLKQRVIEEYQGVLYGDVSQATLLSRLGMSFDMGKTWEVGNESIFEQEWAVSSFGNIVVRMVGTFENDVSDAVLKVSRDSGHSWQSLQLTSQFQPSVLQLLPPRDRDEESLTFLLTSVPEMKSSHLLVITFPAGQKCQGLDMPGHADSDYEVWKVADGGCFGGERVEAVRRKKGVNCMADSAAGLVSDRSSCDCTLLDLLCAAPCYVSENGRCTYECAGVGSGGRDAFAAGPHSACNFDPDVYLDSDLDPSTHDDTADLPYFSNQSSPASYLAASSSSNSTFVAGIYGSIFGICIALCLVCVALAAVTVASYRTFRKRSEAELYGVSALEMEEIDNQILSPLEGSDEETDF